MRLRLDLYNKERELIPYNYKYPLRNALLDLISKTNPSLSEELHENPKKPFAFSDIFGTKGTKKGIWFRTSRVYVSAPDKEVLQSIGESATKKPVLKLEGIPLHITHVYPIPMMRKVDEDSELKTWSPIVLHDEDRGKDLFMDDDNFISLLKYSTRNRFEALTGGSYDGPLKVLDVELTKRKRYKIKNTHHRGSLGKFRIKAEGEMYEFIFDCGLGNKTKMGFGFIGGMKH